MSTADIVVLVVLSVVTLTTAAVGFGLAARFNRSDDDYTTTVHDEHADDVTCPIPRINEDEGWTGPRTPRWYDSI